MSLGSLLPPESEELVAAELRSGERVVWTGQPNPARMARKGMPILVFGIPWTAFALFWTSAATFAIFGKKNPGRGGDIVGGLFQFFPLFGVPFILIGLGMLSAPYWMRRKAKRTAYVVTDQRVLLFEAKGGGTLIRSFEPERLFDVHRVQQRDGSGDIVFQVGSARSNSEESHSASEVGFFGIDQVKDVETLIKNLMAARRDGGA